MLQSSKEQGIPYRCCVLLSPEDGGYCIRAADLAGVVSEGDTIDEAVDNIKDAYAGAIESYLAHGDPIPWLVPPRTPEKNERCVWVELNSSLRRCIVDVRTISS